MKYLKTIKKSLEKKVFAKVFLLTSLGMLSMNASAGALVDALNNLGLVGQAFIGFLVICAAAYGLWMTFSGARVLFSNGQNNQMTKGEASLKAIGGIVIMSILTWAALLLNEAGIEASTNSALDPNVFGSNSYTIQMVEISKHS